MTLKIKGWTQTVVIMKRDLDRGLDQRTEKP
jgi:hypothetical protein